MTARLTPGQSRFLALLLLGLCLGGVYFLVLSPGVAIYQANGDRIEELSDRLDRYQRLVGNREVLGRSAQRVRRSSSASGYYLKDNTAALAAAELQARVKGLVGRAGGRLVSTQPLVDVGAGAEREVRIRVRMRSDTEALRAVVHALESEIPLLLLDNVSIVRARRVRRKARVETQGPLQVNFDLTGFLHGAGS